MKKIQICFDLFSQLCQYCHMSEVKRVPVNQKMHAVAKTEAARRGISLQDWIGMLIWDSMPENNPKPSTKKGAK